MQPTMIPRRLKTFARICVLMSLTARLATAAEARPPAPKPVQIQASGTDGVIVKPLHDPLNPVAFQPVPEGLAVMVVAVGQPQATVVVRDGALKDKQAVETLAARELIEHVKLATGAELPMVEAANVPAAGTLILVGESAVTEALGLSVADLPMEGFRVQTFDKAGRQGLMIAGRPATSPQASDRNGTLFGVYDWLERFVGVRWYYPGKDGTVVPELTELTSQPVHYVDAPVFLKRDPYLVQRDLDWQSMLRRYRVGNSSSVPFTACHTPGSWRVHADHPETFELRANGTRADDMPCYGNPKTAELYVEDVARYYETGDAAVWGHPSNPNSAWFPPSRTVIPISPPDKGVECCCEFCQPLYDADADRHGRASKVVAQHVHLVAEAVKRRWPDKLVWYLPYANYTVPPDDLELPDNVVVGLCLMYGAGNAKEPGFARVHDHWIRAWARITGRKVHLWEYLCWPADDTALPFQYPQALKEFYTRNRDVVEGSFINGGYAPAGLPGGNFASFHPTLYCWMRLLWNPDFEVDAALDEMVVNLYGPAREPMGKLLDQLIARWEDTRWSELSADHHVSPRQIHEETMPREEAQKLADWLAEARRLAGEEGVVRRRVDFLGRAVDIFQEESRDFHDQTGVPLLPVLKVGDRPKIDGKLDEPCWRDAVAHGFANATDAKKPTPEVPTTVQAVWTADGVTFGFRFSEPAPDKLRRERTAHDQDVYWDDCIEVFLDPSGERSAYCQIIVNSIGTIFDRHSQAGAEWTAEGLERAVQIQEDAWTLELFVPFAAFPGKTPKPAVGDLWYGNFIRSRFAGGPWQLTRWSTKYRYSNLDFSAFGKLRFVE